MSEFNFSKQFLLLIYYIYKTLEFFNREMDLKGLLNRTGPGTEPCGTPRTVGGGTD